MTNEQEASMLTTAQCAADSGMSQQFILDEIRRGKLRAQRFGSQFRIAEWRRYKSEAEFAPAGKED